MPNLFINYRREDSTPYAGRLYDRLSAHFGEASVFMDIDKLEAGIDFVEVIERAISQCDVLLILIGTRWLSTVDGTGQRRLDNPDDFVRLEIQTALERDIRMIPVLVGGATMPSSRDLPAALTKLARRHALELSDTRWHTDVGKLLKAVERFSAAAQRRVEEEERRRREEDEAAQRRTEEERRQREEAAEAARRLAQEQQRQRDRVEAERRYAEEKCRQRKEAAEAARRRTESKQQQPSFREHQEYETPSLRHLNRPSQRGEHQEYETPSLRHLNRPPYKKG